MKETPKQKYNRVHRVRLNAEKLAYYHANKDWLNKNRKLARDANPEHARKQCMKYYYRNRSQRLVGMSVYKKNNRAKVNEYARNKKKTDPSFYWAAKMRSFLWHTLRGKYTDTCVEPRFGCGTLFLIDHIASQFEDGMSWGNHGKWEIDHIIPCRAFDCSDPVQRKVCWHYSNMRPLWYNPHKRKNATIPAGFNVKEYVKTHANN